MAAAPANPPDSSDSVTDSGAGSEANAGERGTISLDSGQPLDLESSLLGGQAHRWQREGRWCCGVLRGQLVLIRQEGNVLEFHCAPSPSDTMAYRIRQHLRLDDDLPAIQAEIAFDANVAAQIARYPGLRVLRQEPWECLIAYICSANSNLETIHRNLERMSDAFGEPLTLTLSDGNGSAVIRRYTFPTPIDLAEAGEAELRRLKLGFRAPYVHRAALAVAEKRLDLDYLLTAPYAEVKAQLMALKGIGDKIADCIALMSLEKSQAFPIDVWVRRALAEWYFPGQKTPTNRVLLEWAQNYFGQYAGYANQYLFHGRRLRERKLQGDGR